MQSEESLANPLMQRYLDYSGGILTLPALDYLNEQAGRLQIVTGGCHPLRFALPEPHVDYELQAYRSGVVSTRPDNWHDAFNALVWLKFPKSKAALNFCHIAARERVGSERKQRGKARDALTQFDECGVVVAGTSPTIWQALSGHQWTDVFVDRRSELLATTRFIVFGHGSLDALRAPFVGLCGKAVFIPIDADGLAAVDAADLREADNALARRVISTNSSSEAVLRLQPLPLLGIPGATDENTCAGYYQDTRQFRPIRLSTGER